MKYGIRKLGQYARVRRDDNPGDSGGGGGSVASTPASTPTGKHHGPPRRQVNVSQGRTVRVKLECNNFPRCKKTFFSPIKTVQLNCHNPRPRQLLEQELSMHTDIC